MPTATSFHPPLLRVAPEFERLLRKVCEEIIADARAGRASSATGEWLLENYSYLRTQIREIRESMPRAYYQKLPTLPDAPQPRIFTITDDLAAAHAQDFTPDSLVSFIDHAQQSTVLLLSELWAVRPMLKIALLKRLGSSLTSSPLESPETEASVRLIVTGLRSLDEIEWPEFVEALYIPDRVLRQQPQSAYAGMDFNTRDRYRRAIEEFARHSRHTELEIAEIAVGLAVQSGRHVGAYLIGDATPELRHAARARRTPGGLILDVVQTTPSVFYLGGALALSIAILRAVEWLAGPLPWWFLACLFLPTSQSALATVNLLVSYFLTPRVQPRMDFRSGIPDEFRTVVVVPTLLLSRSGTQRLIDNLEIYYLANRDPNLSFALLTDFPDADFPNANDPGLIEHCVARIQELNHRYGIGGNEPFFLLHRDSVWNEQECRWMGRERKRGKLDDFNAFLLGHDNRFSIVIGNLSQIEGIRYVITLDSDTQLPRDTAAKLVGTMAHPLNRPVFDPDSGIVKWGYALMQPRIGISMESAAKSRFSRVYSGQTGFDPYTTAVSDVYQDLFGRATFTGKGIYDVAAFERATRGRFPDNTLLSHDLIEGEHVRAGLVTDLEMIDDYPSRYQAFSKRKHRWVRGDWQIAMWLLPRVPDATWKWVPNSLPFVSRWKIFDNLRRSLVEPFYFAAFLSAWLLLDTQSAAATRAVLAILLFPIYGDILISLLRPPPLRFLRPWAWTRFSDFLRGHLEAVLTLIFLPAQALLMVDAIVRTLYRRTVSHRHLLEWESMAQAEMASGPKPSPSEFLSPPALLRIVKAWNLPERYIAAAVAASTMIWATLLSLPDSGNLLAFTIVLTWVACPALMVWLNGAPPASAHTAGESDFLRGVALATWRYFADHQTPDDHWLVPDNVQEDPPAVAHRTSPTNIGLQLNAYVAAHRFGYLTHQQFAAQLQRMQTTLTRMERDHGHFFNWYDTRTLSTLTPRFVSTVDSGNLAASLIVTRQGCLAILDEPVVSRNTLLGLRDHLLRLTEAIPLQARTPSFLRAAESLHRQLESEPDDFFFWEGVLTEILAVIDGLSTSAESIAHRLPPRASAIAGEIRYWAAALRSRALASLTDLGELVPWIHQPFETELRMTLRNPRLAELMEKLRAVPKLCHMGDLYDGIEAMLNSLDTSDARIHDSTFEVLGKLGSSLPEARARWQHLVDTISHNAELAFELSREMDFRFLLDDRKKLLRIGWNAEAGELQASFYDLLASEARTAVFVAIARGDAPREAWFQLGRKLTYYRGHRTLISWSGTMFEYLMPALFMQTWDGTLLGESLRSVVRIQRLYARERRVPWGISESAHAVRDGALNYQYKAFGVPSLGMDRILPDDLVIAPYATILSLMVDPRAALENLRHMESRGWLARYGFYEAIDFRRRGRGPRKPEVIRAFMVHHQGMSFLALANVLLGNSIQKLFHSDPSVLATELLLQERMPALAQAQAPEEPFAGLFVAGEDAGHSALEAEPV